MCYAALYHLCPIFPQSICAGRVCSIHWTRRTLSHFSSVKHHPDNDSTSPAGSVLWPPPTLCDYCRWQHSAQNRLEGEWNSSYNFHITFPLFFQTFPVSTCILYEAKQRITCMSHDPAHLFSVFMCTRNHLLAIDLREPGRLVLSVLLEITRPPFFITFTSSHEESE